MPGFVQIMEFDTSKIEEVDALSRQLQEGAGRCPPGQTGDDDRGP